MGAASSVTPTSIHRVFRVLGQALPQPRAASDLRQLRHPQNPAAGQRLATHPRFQLHFTPTSASWLNLVERWFGLITAQAIRRGSFDSVRREHAITRHLAQCNETAKPFRWTKSAAKIKRSIRNAA